MYEALKKEAPKQQTIQKKDAKSKPNYTGISDTLKAKYENRSGFSFDDVKVHYNSDKPAQFQALAYTQGNQVFMAPRQEKHLEHELGHVVQQKQGVVKQTGRINNVAVNEDKSLERKADYLGQSVVSSRGKSDNQKQILIMQRKDSPNYLNGVGSPEARHHIIPDNILKKFILKIKGNVAVYTKLLDAVSESYCTYHQVDESEIADAKQLKTSEQIVAWKKNHNTKRDNFLLLIAVDKENDAVSYNEEMEKAFVWSPGNLVIGPKARGADPKEDFDSEAATIADIEEGITAGNELQDSTGQAGLKVAIQMMQGYVNGESELNENIVCNILIPHIKRKIKNGSNAIWK